MAKKNAKELLELIFGVFLTLFGGSFLIKTILAFSQTLANILTIAIFSVILIIGLLLLGDAMNK